DGSRQRARGAARADARRVGRRRLGDGEARADLRRHHPARARPPRATRRRLPRERRVRDAARRRRARLARLRRLPARESARTEACGRRRDLHVRRPRCCALAPRLVQPRGSVVVVFFTTTLVAIILSPCLEKKTVTGAPAVTDSISTGFPASST